MGQVIAVQPHRYTRLHAFEQSHRFNDADSVIVADVRPEKRRSRLRPRQPCRGNAGAENVLPLDGLQQLASVVKASPGPATTWSPRLATSPSGLTLPGELAAADAAG